MAPALKEKAHNEVESLKETIFHLNFFRCHLLYFIFVIIISSVIFYGSGVNQVPPIGEGVSYIDSLFLCASAMTNTGLNTVDLGWLTGFQQSILFVLMLMGDLTLASISIVIVRRYYFRKKMKDFTEHSKAGKKIADDIERGEHHKSVKSPESGQPEITNCRMEETSDIQSVGRADQGFKEANEKPSSNGSSMTRSSSRDRKIQKQRELRSHEKGHGGFPTPWNSQAFQSSVSYPFRKLFPDNDHSKMDHHYLSFEPEVDHKGRFRSLDREQHRELGGVEYKALGVLCWLLPAYTCFWLFFGLVILVPYASHDDYVFNTVQTLQPGNLNPVWWSSFISISSYTNCGLDLVNQSQEPWADTYLILIVTGTVIVAGNTFYPVFLRLLIWTLTKILPKNTELHHSLSFLLHHSRRCYLFLYDKKTTWILAAVQGGITLTVWVFFEILNIQQTEIDPDVPPPQRVMDGLYSALGTRAAGFYLQTVSGLAPALQVLYMVVMYISAFPIILSVKQTNVYEERSIGLDPEQIEEMKQSKGKGKPPSQLGNHLRSQLAYDLWWLILAIWLITIIERDSLNVLAPGYSIFAIIFETVSAYGTVGLSLGVPYDYFSLCGTFHTGSKLILISVMLRGRHRILPSAVDRAVLLPGQGLMEEMDKSYNPRLAESREKEIRKEEEGAQAEDSDGRQDPEGGDDKEADKQQSETDDKALGTKGESSGGKDGDDGEEENGEGQEKEGKEEQQRKGRQEEGKNKAGGQDGMGENRGKTNN